MTVSLGWASYPADQEIASAEMLVYLADQALLVAKETGRNRVVGFGELTEDVRSRLVRQVSQAPEPTLLPADPAEMAISNR